MGKGAVATFPGRCVNRFTALRRFLHVMRTNVAIKRIGKGSLVPSRTLTVDQTLRPNVFSARRVDCRRTVTCLHGRTVSLSRATPHNCMLLACESIPLNFIGGVNGHTGGLCPRR